MWAGTEGTPSLPPPESQTIFNGGDNMDDPNTMIKSRYLSMHNPKSSSRIDRTGLPRPRTRSNRRLSAKRKADSKLGSPKSKSSTPKRRKSPLPVIDLTKSSEDDYVKEETPFQSPKNDNETNEKHTVPLKNDSKELEDHKFQLSNPASSPIAKPSHFMDSPSPLKAVPNSSPIKRKKSVAFTAWLETNTPSSPLCPLMTPRKSILKPNLANDEPLQDPNNTALWSTKDNSSNSPSNPKFWTLGTIIQLPVNSSELFQLVRGCVKVLEDESFDKKFEVYASLNHICKFNSTELLQKLFIHNGAVADSRTNSPSKSSDSNFIGQIAVCIQRDIQTIEEKLFQNRPPSVNTSPIKGEDDELPPLIVSPSKGDPFSIRTISQALKFIFFVLSDLELNQFLSLSSVTWFYHHSCDMVVNPQVTKTLLLPYLSIIKDVSVIGRKKKAIFQDEVTPLLEKMLFALLNMKSMSSSSLILEKFLTLRNLVTTFPIMMANHLDQWFGVLVVNLCDLTSPMYSKVIAVGISVLLEVAKTYLDNKNVLFSIRQFMKLPIPEQVKSFSSEHRITSSSSLAKDQAPVAVDYVVSALHSLILNGQYKSAMDIWLGLTLLCNNTENGFERWSLLPQWLNVHKLCINSGDYGAIKIAIANWRGIIYNICINDLCDLRKYFETNSPVLNLSSPASGTRSPLTPKLPKSKKSQQEVTNVTRPKIRLLLHVLLSTESFQDKQEIIDLLHNVFLSIIYTLLNPLGNRNALKYTHFYWDRIIEEVFRLFYFKKNFSSAYMNELGINLLSRWLKGTSSTPVNANYNDLRCLSIEPVGLNEINCLPPRWVHARFERIFNTLGRIFELETISISNKLGVFNSFLNNLKLTTKKEMTPSNETLDIVDNLPAIMEVFYANNKPTYSNIQTLLINLIDTFTGAILMNNVNSREDSLIVNIYGLILKHASKNFEAHEVLQLLELLFNSVGDKNQFSFLFQVYTLQTESNKELFEKFVVDKVNYSKINAASNFELLLTSQLFKKLDNGYSIVAKKLFQDLVLLKEEEFSRRVAILKINNWTFPLFRYFITSVHGSPFAHLDKLIVKLLEIRMNDSDEFFPILQFLVELNYEFELRTLSSMILQRFSSFDLNQKLKFNDIWKCHIKAVYEKKDFEYYDILLRDSEVAGYDIKPHIKNLWDKLPVLKDNWNSRNLLLYWETPIPSFNEPSPDSKPNTATDNVIVQPLPEEKDSTQEDITEEPVIVEQPIEAKKLDVSEVEEVPDLLDPEIPKRRKTRRSKTPDATLNKIKKAAKQLEFDIHSFTASMNAKLTTSSKPTKDEEKQSQIENKETQTDTNESQISPKAAETINDAELPLSNKIVSMKQQEEDTTEKETAENTAPINTTVPEAAPQESVQESLDLVIIEDKDKTNSLIEIIDVDDPRELEALSTPTRSKSKRSLRRRSSKRVNSSLSRSGSEDATLETPESNENMDDKENGQLLRKRPRSKTSSPNKRRKSPLKVIKQVSMSEEDSITPQADSVEEEIKSTLELTTTRATELVKSTLLQLLPRNKSEFAAETLKLIQAGQLSNAVSNEITSVVAPETADLYPNLAIGLHKLVRGISADDISQMTVLEKHKLETELIKLMLRLKTSTSIPTPIEDQ